MRITCPKCFYYNDVHNKVSSIKCVHCKSKIDIVYEIKAVIVKDDTDDTIHKADSDGNKYY